jgi:hypothetical protein
MGLRVLTQRRIIISDARIERSATPLTFAVKSPAPISQRACSAV